MVRVAHAIVFKDFKTVCLCLLCSVRYAKVYSFEVFCLSCIQNIWQVKPKKQFAATPSYTLASFCQ